MEGNYYNKHTMEYINAICDNCEISNVFEHVLDISYTHVLEELHRRA